MGKSWKKNNSSNIEFKKFRKKGSKDLSDMNIEQGRKKIVNLPKIKYRRRQLFEELLEADYESELEELTTK